MARMLVNDYFCSYYSTGLNQTNSASATAPMHRPHVFAASLQEALAAAEDLTAVDWRGSTFQTVDFSPLEHAELSRIIGRAAADACLGSEDERRPTQTVDADSTLVEGAMFLGCELPGPSHAGWAVLSAAGAEVLLAPKGLAFNPFRSFLYGNRELKEQDDAILRELRQAMTSPSPRHAVHAALHDHTIKAALMDYLSGKSVVALMGGHSLSRRSEEYRTIVLIGRELSRHGFVVATGGGPGAMEAANLGAYLRDHTDADLDEALRLLSTDADNFEHEFLNMHAAELVIERFGPPSWLPNLGVPTWHYGHEPSNLFATWHAKFFSNAVREAGLIQIANAGVIYSKGSAGTRQEVFQDACRNHYGASYAPMIFLDVEFWTQNGIFDLVRQTSKGREYHKLLLMTDDVQQIVDHCVNFRQDRKLPLFSDEDIQREVKMRDEAVAERVPGGAMMPISPPNGKLPLVLQKSLRDRMSRRESKGPLDEFTRSE